MGKPNLFSAVLSLFLLVPASITWAQTITSQKGLTTVEFSLPQGKIKVYLPEDIRPGDIISGTIVAEATGKNAKQVEKNLAELGKSSVIIDGNKVIPGSFQPFNCLFAGNRPVALPVELIFVSGQKNIRLLLPLHSDRTDGAQSCAIPSHAVVNSPVRITGDFDGNSSNTQCRLDDTALEVLAESPRQCVIQYPENANDLQTLSVKETGKLTSNCERKVSAVKMDVTAGKLDLHKGEQTYIDVQITGLQHLPARAVLHLDNLSSAVVVMLPDNNIIIPLMPDSVGSGIVNKRFDIQSLQTGRFIINVGLDLPDNDKVRFDIPTTVGDGKLDTIPCQELEAILTAKEKELADLKDEQASINGQIRNAKLALIDCKDALEALSKDYWAAKDKFDYQDRRVGYWKTDKKDVPADVQKDYDDAKKDKEDAARRWSVQDRKCKELEQKIVELEQRKLSLPGLIKSLEEEIGKIKDAIEKCRQKEAEAKKKKEDEERRKTETLPSPGETTKPGEGDKGKEGSPCNPGGSVLTETKRKYDPCEVESTEVTKCGVGKIENAALDAIKDFLEKFKKTKSPVELAGKLADCASTAKAICINIHIIRKWKDIEYKYECINGKWVLMNQKVSNHGEDDYGWFKVEDKTIGCCWIFDGSGAMKKELENKIQERLDLCK